MFRTVSESLSPAPGRVSLEAGADKAQLSFKVSPIPHDGPNRAQLSFEDRRVSPIPHYEPNRAQLSFEDRSVSPILHRKLSFEEPNGTLLFEERRVSTISERQNGNVAEDIIVVETTFVN